MAPRNSAPRLPTGLIVSPDQRHARQAFGNRLREIRLDAGLSGRQLADDTGFHYTKVSRVEHGGQSLSDADIRTWCTACNADALAPDLIAQMRAVDTHYREWRKHARAGLRRIQENDVPLYDRTKVLRIYEHWSVPGLFQTPAYSATCMAWWTRLLRVPDDIAATNAVRMDRQRVLREGDHRFVFLLAEQVLHAVIGSTDIMVEQLDRIVDVMALPSVSLGIIPLDAGMGTRTQTAFWIFDNSLVQVETLTACLDITRPEEIELYATVFDQMRQAAVFGAHAKALITQARHQLLQPGATP
jgi:transcriptional regulator with XRE-family HTH domain